MGAYRDCKNCTNSAFAHAGRKWGRRTAGLMTIGVSEIALATQKKCRQCGHQMSLARGYSTVDRGTPHPVHP